MSTYRDEIKRLLGKTIPGSTAILSERSGGRNGYGYLLNDIVFPDGSTTDHAWIGGGEGKGGCVRWADGTACLGHRIRFTAVVREYYSAGAERHGRDDAGIGVRIANNNVEVEIDGQWLPISEGAKLLRQWYREEIKQSKAAGDYFWPGSWTYATGDWKVKAAKSAKPGDLCNVRSKGGMKDETVVLASQADGIWDWDYTPERKAELEKEKQAEAARKAAEQQQREEERRRMKLLRKFRSLKTEKRRSALLAADPWLAEAERLQIGKEQEEAIAAKQREEIEQRKQAEGRRQRERRKYEREQQALRLAEDFISDATFPYVQGRWTLLRDGTVLLDGSTDHKSKTPPSGLAIASRILAGRLPSLE